jgi:dinuclear metal center YbgI/SA1388 family protein
MDIQQLVGAIKDFADLDWTEDWDNTGIMLDCGSGDISRIAVTLDIVEETVDRAYAEGCDLIVSHHPLIFSPLYRVDRSSLSSRMILSLMQKGISAISLHTNWDVSPFGVNMCLSDKLELEDVHPLLPAKSGSWGHGACGSLGHALSIPELADKVMAKWDLSWSKLFGDTEGAVERVAICGGSGGDLWRSALEKGADLYITADIKYHDILEACSNGLRIMSVDHGEMESVSMPVLADLVSRSSGIPVHLIRTRSLNCTSYS